MDIKVSTNMIGHGLILKKSAEFTYSEEPCSGARGVVSI
jgi:hypothetical protein